MIDELKAKLDAIDEKRNETHNIIDELSKLNKLREGNYLQIRNSETFITVDPDLRTLILSTIQQRLRHKAQEVLKQEIEHQTYEAEAFVPQSRTVDQGSGTPTPANGPISIVREKVRYETYLLDWFAGQALSGDLAGDPITGDAKDDVLEGRSKFYYRMARAMMKVREMYLSKATNVNR